MKKPIILCLALLLLLPGPAALADHSAAAMILYEPRTGTVLAETNADERMLVASTTKIMTALVVLEHCALEEPVCVREEQTAVEGSSAELRADETYTVEELLTGLLLASGNDAALALAEHTAGSVEAFAALMNAKCAELGLQNTHFMNPHGLNDPEHYSSARDLARLTACAMEDPVFSRLFGCAHAEVHGVSYTNHNKLLTAYPGCIGGKTGYTRAAGRVLVSCAERDGLRLICVTISDPNDWADHAAAYDEAFDHWRYMTLPAREWQALPVLSGTAEEVCLGCDADGVLLPKEGEVRIEVRLPRFAFAPVAAGKTLGLVTVQVNGVTTLEEPLYSLTDVERDGCVLLTTKERFRRGWELYCRYGLNYVYPLER